MATNRLSYTSAIVEAEPSRRRFLGALAAAPLAAVPMVAAAQGPDRAEWDSALIAYRAAAAEAESYYARAVAHAPFEQVEGEGGTQARYDALALIQWERLGALLSTPAPDLAAVATKIEIAIAESIGVTDGAADVLLADVRRLGGEAHHG